MTGNIPGTPPGCYITVAGEGCLRTKCLIEDRSRRPGELLGERCPLHEQTGDHRVRTPASQWDLHSELTSAKSHCC